MAAKPTELTYFCQLYCFRTHGTILAMPTIISKPDLNNYE